MSRLTPEVGSTKDSIIPDVGMGAMQQEFMARYGIPVPADVKVYDPFNITVVSPTLRPLPDAVCGKGEHTGNPHCPVVDTPDPSVVPLPAAAWLFITAIVALVGVKRMKR